MTAAAPGTGGPAASSPAAPPGGGGRRMATLKASAWTLAGYGGSQGLRFVGNLILTRILFPEVFGLAALVSIFIQGLWMFSDVGTGPAIVQSPHGDDPDFLDTCWTIQSMRGVLLWLISSAIAVPVSRFYGQPLLAQLIPVAGLSAVMNGLEATSVHTSVRHLRMRPVIVVELVSQVVSIGSIILLALAYRSVHGPGDTGIVWAVVGGNLLGTLTKLVLTHTYLEHIRHRLRFDLHWMGIQFRFGRWITFSTILSFLAGQSDRLLFGKLVPLQTLGVYNIGSTLALMPTQALEALGSRVLFPTYSRLAGTPAFGASFARLRLPLLLGGAVIVSGMIAAGPHLVRVLYDSRYWEAGWILQFLSVAAWFQILESSNGAGLLALGLTHWKAAIGAAKFASLLVLLPLGFHLDGFRGALLGLVASDVAKYLISSIGVSAHGLRAWRTDAALSIATAVVAFAGHAAGGAVAGGADRNVLPFLISGTLVVAAWGPVAYWAIRRERRRKAAEEQGG